MTFNPRLFITHRQVIIVSYERGHDTSDICFVKQEEIIVRVPNIFWKALVECSQVQISATYRSKL